MMDGMTNAAVWSSGEGAPTSGDRPERATHHAAIAARLSPFAELSELEPERLRLVGPDHCSQPGDIVGAVVFQAINAIETLGDIAPDGIDTESLSQWADGIETVRRMIDAAATKAAGHVDRTNPYKDQGYFTAKTYLKQRLQLSGPEAHRRIQACRLHERLPHWADAETAGSVGIAQTELMARIAANPRVDDALLDRDAPELLLDAQNLPYDEFERNARTWEALADPDGDRARNERQKAQRHATVRPDPEGGYHLTSYLPEAQGAEFVEIFGWFVEAEWQADWADARNRLGNDATQAHLHRTEAQRHADAMLAMARSAAANSVPTGSAPRATVNFLVDQATWETCAAGGTPEPARFRDVVCRTQSGRRLHPDDVVNTSLVAHVRRVVLDERGTVIDLGRRSRVFRGAARDAVMLLATTCVWLGCDRPVHWCDADHSTGWKAHGATVPRNGQPLCRGHNLLKERGFHVHRDDHGDWHVVDPDGTSVR